MYSTLDSTLLKENPITVLLTTDSIKIKSSFDQMLANIKDSLMAWGFINETKHFFSTSDQFGEHWLLNYYFERHKLARVRRSYPRIFLPTATDWQNVKDINQITFSKGNGYVFEEWTLTNDVAANKWVRIVSDARHIDNFKPPRHFWAEGNKIYFVIMKGSTYQRYHSREIVKLMTGKKIKLLNTMTYPLDLPQFKEQAGGANGGTRNKQSFYFKPDTIGAYYEYFWFYALRKLYGESKSVDYLFVETYIYGDKIGQYNSVEEELISIKAKASHKSLGKIDLVGKPRKEMKELYGKPQLEQLGTSVYYHNKTFLILHYSDDKVDWFRYIRTNLTLSQINQLPKSYFEYKGRN